MLKLIITITAMLLSVITFAQTQLKIAADIRGHACSGGFGLCSNNSISEKANGTIVAQKISEKTVLFLINKQDLSIENQKSLAGKELTKVLPSEKIDFKQETDITFDSKTILNLGFQPKYTTVKMGSYPMIIENDTVLITFTLSEK